MITQAVATITLTGGGSYTFPSSFVSLDQVVYTSTDGSVYNPTFADYTLAGNVVTYNSGTGTADQYYSYNDALSSSSPASAKPSLEGMYQKFVIDCGLETSELDKDGSGNYIDTVLFTQFRSEVNRAVRKIARERFKPTLVQTVALDSNLMFDITALNRTLKSIELLTDSNGTEFSFERVSSTQYKVPYGDIGQVLNLTYGYVPNDMVLLADVIDLPAGDVDPDIIGYYANYMYFKVNGNSRKANMWLELWNDGFDEITSHRGEATSMPNWFEQGG